MARWIGPEYDHAPAVLDAAYAWRERCFLADGSLFGDESLWTVENIQELRRRIIDNPIERDAASTDKSRKKSKFIDKFEDKLKTASGQVKRLAAETLWFLYLFPFNLNPDTKHDRIERFWESSGSSLPNNDYLKDQALRGVANTGRAYMTSAALESGFLLQMATRWKNTPKPRREELIDDDTPWNFVEWLDEAGLSARPMRHVVLYFLFPDHMERIVSIDHKRKIVKIFGNRGISEYESEKKISDAGIDRVIYKIRADLEREHGTKELDFYYPPLKEQWDPWEQSVDIQSVSRENTTQKASSTVSISDDIPLNTILYGPPGTGKTYATARRCAAICDGDADDLSDEDIRDRYAALVEEKRIEFVTFHQSYGYEEFVEGLRPQTSSDGAAGFQLAPTDGVLKRIAERARKAPQLPHVLVIDEINRANISKVMGELVTLLEEDKREGTLNEIGVTLPHSRERFTLPPNLHVLGTMNTADRSIALLDFALRRRFSFEEMAPDPGKLKPVDNIDLPAVLRAINKRLEWLLDRDHLIGHAWLMGAHNKAQVDGIMRNKIIPLIAEYFYNDWRKVRAVLGGGNDFVRRKKLKPPPDPGDDAGEDRYRWTIRKKFDDGAYDRLISGSRPAGTGKSEKSGGRGV